MTFVITDEGLQLLIQEDKDVVNRSMGNGTRLLVSAKACQHSGHSKLFQYHAQKVMGEGHSFSRPRTILGQCRYAVNKLTPAFEVKSEDVLFDRQCSDGRQHPDHARFGRLAA